MVRIDSGVNVSLQELSNEFFERLNPGKRHTSSSRSLKGRFIKAYQNCLDYQEKQFYEVFLEDDFKMLQLAVTATPYVLEEEVIKHIDSNISNNQFPLLSSKENNVYQLTQFGSSVLKVFNYRNFRSSKHAAWLSKELNISVCPYCNREQTFLVKEKLLHDLDHFYAKCQYPYLSLSFYNLVPACGICNAVYKRDKEFSIQTHLHPYFDCFHSTFKFSVSKPIIHQDDRDFEIVFLQRDAEKSSIIRGRSNIVDLGLEEVYQHHKEEVIRIFKMQNCYSYWGVQSIIDSTSFNGIPLFKDNDDVFNTFIDFATTPDGIRKKVLGKLKYDIAEEFQVFGYKFT